VTLTAADVAEIMRLVEQSTFDELTLEVDGMKLCLRRGGAAERSVSSVVPRSEPQTSSPPPQREKTSAPPPPDDPNIHTVTSPLLGTFYRAPKPGSPPFVEIGSRVEPDTVIAIVEVMKLMNAVRAGVSGTVTEILANDGVLVEFGETLLRVRKD
jgi:acetyl-CoA carboxylase biotin carboxyl carrier protein